MIRLFRRLGEHLPVGGRRGVDARLAGERRGDGRHADLPPHALRRDALAVEDQRHVRVVAVHRPGGRDHAVALLDPPRHEVEHHVARAARIKAILHQAGVAAAEVARAHGRRGERMRHAVELHGEGRHLVLHLREVEPPFVDEVVVEPQRALLVAEHPVAHAVADVQEAVDDHLELPGVEALGRCGARIERGAGAVVRGEDHDGVAVAHLREEVGQEVGQIAIQPVVHVLDLDRLGSVGLHDAARGVEADGQQVGHLVRPEAVLCDGLLGEGEQGAVARGRAAQPLQVVGRMQAPLARLVLLAAVAGREGDVPVARVAVAGAVEQRAPLLRKEGEVVVLAVAAGDPVGQLLRIVGRRGPVAAPGVEPEDVAALPGQEDGRFGLGGDGHRAAFGALRAQRLGQRRGDEVVGAGAALAFGQEDRLVRGVVPPCRADDAVHRGHGARCERCERDGRRGLHAVVAGVGIACAALGQALQPAVAEIRGVALQVAGPHRADDDLHDQPRPGRSRRECRGSQQEQDDSLLHGAYKRTANLRINFDTLSEIFRLGMKIHPGQGGDALQHAAAEVAVRRRVRIAGAVCGRRGDRLDLGQQGLRLGGERRGGELLPDVGDGLR